MNPTVNLTVNLTVKRASDLNLSNLNLTTVSSEQRGVVLIQKFTFQKFTLPIPLQGESSPVVGC